MANLEDHAAAESLLGKPHDRHDNYDQPFLQMSWETLSQTFSKSFVAEAVRRYFDHRTSHEDAVADIMECLSDYHNFLQSEQKTLRIQEENQRREEIRSEAHNDIFKDVPKHIDTISFPLRVYKDSHTPPERDHETLYDVWGANECCLICECCLAAVDGPTPAEQVGHGADYIIFGCECIRYIISGMGHAEKLLPPAVVQFLNHMNVEDLATDGKGGPRPVRVTLYRNSADYKLEYFPNKKDKE